jgi:hypothetical protein
VGEAEVGIPYVALARVGLQPQRPVVVAHRLLGPRLLAGY